MVDIKEILTKEEFKAEVLRHDTLLVQFFSETCPPCRKMCKMLQEAELTVPLIKINAVENIDLARIFSISGVPALIIFKKGEPSEIFHGVIPVETILKHVNNVKNI